MLAPPLGAGSTAAPSPGEVFGCERIEAGARRALFRVTLAVGDLSPVDAAGARLIVVDAGATLRLPALPGPPRPPAPGSTVTLGFAIAPSATPLGLDLGDRVLALPEPQGSGPQLERQLRAERAALAEARAACALAQIERDTAARARDDATRQQGEALRERNEALRGRDAALADRDAALRMASRAEAAAHDASERAASLARRPLAAPAAPSRLAAGAGSRRTPRRAAATVLGLGSATLLAAVLAWPADDGESDRGVGGVAAASAASAPRTSSAPVDPLAARLGIPATYLALYRRAGARYGLDWTRLAAVGAIESEHGQARGPGILAGVNPRGASGPAQFLPDTWERYGVDGNGDGDRNPYDPADAIPAMASYLRASGAPQDWPGALRAYNHSDDYVRAVQTLAASLRGDAS